MKYWLPLLVMTALYGLFGYGPTETTVADDGAQAVTHLSRGSGAKLIGGLTPPDGDQP